ncbi:MAG: hypothetical protein QME44_03045 [Thermodesulfobacteriota bacterium]|nr:hypothetical protein [Thermodesulfobacteriota bacterium]
MSESVIANSFTQAVTQNHFDEGKKYYYRINADNLQCKIGSLVHHQGIICGVAFDRFSLRRIAPYASVVAPRRLASNILLVLRNNP